MRLQGTNPQQIKEIIINNFGLNYESVKESDSEWQNFKSDIIFNVKEEEKKYIRPSDYIKVPFKEALNLVGQRQVFVRKGIAYVPL